MNHVGLSEGAAREGGREDPRIAAGAHSRSPISMMRSVMASCTEPPYTPECRSLSLHSTCGHTGRSAGCSPELALTPRRETGRGGSHGTFRNQPAAPQARPGAP